jgi:hypothetical protein
MPTIPALGRLRQEDGKFKPGLHIETMSGKKKTKDK